MHHTPVLLEETLDALDQKPGARFIDGTVGDGGHSAALMERLGGQAEILGIDLDVKALATAKARLAKWGDKVKLAQGNFRDMREIAAQNGWNGVTGILLDLGIRSAEIEESGLGFSFRRDEPLVMRFDGGTEPPTAASVVNGYRKDELVQVLREYGEEPRALRIAEAIVEARREKKIMTTGELVEAIAKAFPPSARHGKIHFATKVFQALRIEVNDELASEKRAIAEAIDLLVPGGTLAVISFHSLEDRIVKNAFRELSRKGLAEVPFKKPKIPSGGEVALNPRARSAKLRAARRAKI